MNGDTSRRVERTSQFPYTCFGGCGREFNSLDEMVFVAGRGNRSGRHFCHACARQLPHRPEEAYHV